jgi:hypothetical protein
VRNVTNDELAAKASERAKAAKSGSRERNIWSQVAKALYATGSQEGARTLLRGLTIPTLSQHSIRFLNRLIAGELDTMEEQEAS